jgi:hypothetical protein
MILVLLWLVGRAIGLRPPDVFADPFLDRHELTDD